MSFGARKSEASVQLTLMRFIVVVLTLADDILRTTWI
jgi:hypothetical protein